jgi:hypothetical protein
MTSSNLVGYIKRYRILGEKQISIEPDRIYLAGTWSQNEICSELRLLQQWVNLTLIQGQERYQFTPMTVKGATNATPIVLEITSHVLNTGDCLVVGGALGNTGANGRWPTITKVDANHVSLDGSVGNGTYTANSGTAYHGLNAALDVKFLRKKESPYGRIKRKLIETVEDERWEFAAEESPTSEVNHLYITYDEPLIIGIRGIPNTTIKTEALIIRKPLPSEDLSETVNPILPSQYDQLLYRGTLYHVLELLDLPEAEEALAMALGRYEQEKVRTLNTISRSRIVRDDTSTSLQL